MALSRRGLITGLISLVAAPAIVRVVNIMPVRAEKLSMFVGEDITFTCTGARLSATEVEMFYNRISSYMFANGITVHDSEITWTPRS